jgi:hypothetical protein
VFHARLSRNGNILCDILHDLPEPNGVRRNVCAGNLSTASGDRSGNYRKAWHTPVVDLCKGM